MKNLFKSKAYALLLALVLVSSSIFAQATCKVLSRVKSGDLRVTAWYCSDGSYSVVVSINLNGVWMPVTVS
jgi:hypothetical protein